MRSTKVCTRCRRSLYLSEFYKRPRSKNNLHSICRKCLCLYRAQYGVTELVKRKRNLLNQYKNKPCADCGKSYPPCVMDFDHRDESKKSFNISSAVTSKGFVALAAEIRKCDIVCSNCHRIRTWIKREGRHLHRVY